MTQAQTCSPTAAFRAPFVVRDYENRDREQIFGLLAFLPLLYPNSFEWLERRLEDVQRRRAYCTIARAPTYIAGILIETPKGRRTTKISTLYVRKEVWGLGLGAHLLNRSRDRWHNAGIERAFVTVAGNRRATIDAFLASKGFDETARLPDRYGPGRDESIYSIQID